MGEFYILDKFGLKWAKIYANFISPFLIISIGLVGFFIAYLQIQAANNFGYFIFLLTIVAILLLFKANKWMLTKINQHQTTNGV